MNRSDNRGHECVAFGCRKRFHTKDKPKSDSEGSEDNESFVKKNIEHFTSKSY